MFDTPDGKRLGCRTEPVCGLIDILMYHLHISACKLLLTSFFTVLLYIRIILNGLQLTVRMLYYLIVVIYNPYETIGRPRGGRYLLPSI